MPTRLRLPRLTPTNETDYLNRRRFIQTIGAGAIAMSTAGIGCAATSDDMDDATRKRILRPGIDRDAILKQFPFHRNKAFDFDAKLTDNGRGDIFSLIGKGTTVEYKEDAFTFQYTYKF